MGASLFPSYYVGSPLKPIFQERLASDAEKSWYMCKTELATLLPSFNPMVYNTYWSSVHNSLLYNWINYLNETSPFFAFQGCRLNIHHGPGKRSPIGSTRTHSHSGYYNRRKQGRPKRRKWRLRRQCTAGMEHCCGSLSSSILFRRIGQWIIPLLGYPRLIPQPRGVRSEYSRNSTRRPG